MSLPRMPPFVLLLATIVAPLTSPTVLAQGQRAGDLDSTFGQGGKVFTAFSAFGGHSEDAALQPDGRILAAGETFVPAQGWTHEGTARARWTFTT